MHVPTLAGSSRRWPSFDPEPALRNLVAAIAIALVAALGVAGPAAATQTSVAKVVIIVGATHGTTPAYRADADSAYAEAIKYTSHVTKVYSPNATWSKVKAAVYNANIVIYFGHGNGWPSPYTYDPTYSTKDGFGLNADLNGDGKLSDYENKYYGEPYMAQLHLAANAIVILNHLCYASGDSEPGLAQPTVTVAHQRIDNYAAGFIRGGARAVIADGMSGPEPYLDGLFTTGQSVVDLWRSMPNYHDHESSFASTRTPGYTDYADPTNTTTNFYRSLVTAPGLTTTAVTNAVGDTGVDPASLVVPGRAAVAVPDAPLMATATASADVPPLLSLPDGTRLKTIATAVPAASGIPAIIQVQGLDDGSIAGYISAADLAPRDSRAPVLIGIDTGTGRFSPNDDGRNDEQTMIGIFSETVDWTVEVKDGNGVVLDTTTGTGSTFSVPWDGLVDGIAVPDGSYAWTARGTDAWQNGTASGGGTIVVDTVGVDVGSISPDGSTVGVFSPNGDGVADTMATTVTVPEAGSIAAWVTDAGDATVRSWTATSVAGANTLTWDGRTANGATAPDGDYTLHFTARDRTGTNGVGKTRPVRVIDLLSAVRSSVRSFYPQDGDRFAPTTTLSFTIARPATVTWTVRNAAGNVVATHLADAALAAGTQTWIWDGTDGAGTRLPLGAYTVTVSASDGTFAISQSVKVDMNAFAIATSTSTPHRGSKMLLVATSAEPLSSGVIVYVQEPGLATWHVTLTKVDSRVFKATITLKTGGAAGTVRITVKARDLDGRTQSTVRTLTLT
jgi:flagellar hook assembly protein FlgD